MSFEVCSQGMKMYSGRVDEDVLEKATVAEGAADDEGVAAGAKGAKGFKTSLATLMTTSYCDATAREGSEKRKMQPP